MAIVIKRKSGKVETNGTMTGSLPAMAMFRGKFPSRWDFWKEGVTSSILTQWLQCREQSRLSLVEGWRAYNVPLALAFGTCMHWCLEHAYKSPKPATPAECKALVKEYEKLWRKERPGASKKQAQTQEEVYALVDAVLPCYMTRYAGDFASGKYPKGYELAKPYRVRRWIGLETKFCIPWTYEDGKTTFIRGTRDALYENGNGQVTNFDTKCLSMIKMEDIMDSLPSNLQQMTYLWATMKERGKAPAGTTMNIIRRPGTHFRKDDTLRSWSDHVKEEVTKKLDWHFMRVHMSITEGEIKTWEREVLTPIMLDVRAWWEGRAPHYMNPNSLITKYGRCDMFNIMVYGNSAGYYRRAPGTIMNYQTDIA